jgi:hypothetical protein
MNYYASGGQAHGLKSLAQELRSYGRNGDTILAHINPKEAGILKALGGSGTINPDTGLPEYFFKAVSRAVAAPFKAVNQVVIAIPVIGPAIDRGLVSLDKAVGSAIPGGWNTLAQTALAFTPLGLPAKVGLAALGGSGAFGKEGKFNFQKALLSGAMAYGMNQLTAGLQNAGSTAYDPSAGLTDATAKAASNIDPGLLEGMTAEQVANAASSTPYFQAAQSNIDPSFLEGMSASDVAGANVLPSVPNAPAPSFLQQTGANLSAAGRGITNLSGLGTGTVSEAATKFAAPVTTAGMTALGVGTMGLASLDEQEKALSQQYQQGQVNDTEYNRQMALIADGRRRAEEAIKANPYQFAEGGEVPGYFFGGNIGKIIGENTQIREALMSPEQRAQTQAKELSNLGIRQNIVDAASQQQLQDYVNAMRKSENEKSAYRSMINNPYGFARGGQVDDELGGDYSAMGMDQGNLQKGLFGMGYAMGGQPRFLSGGGDGMSDSIQATINDKQPARLADGEFVIPADVVSGIGNGSSKAGAKRLYSMMDRVRKERTGTTKQAKAINPAKVMAA